MRLEDAGSKNKLILDGRRLELVDLQPGIVVQVGKVFLTVEHASSDEFDLAVKARTPDLDLLGAPVEDTEDSPGLGVAEGPVVGLRLIRQVERDGISETLLADALEALGLDSILVFELDDEGQCALSKVIGVLPIESRMLALEEELRGVAVQAATWLESSEQPGIAYRSTEGQSARCVVGLRSTPARMDSWEVDLFEYLAIRLLGLQEDVIPPARSQRKGLTLSAGMIVGESRAFRSLLQQLEAVADTKMDVLLIGETGTGKELLARTIHASGPSSSGPFVAINCAAIPSELLEAELFGVRGRVATGVDPRVGLFVRADGGSIFLDEIGELAEPLQAKLLRVLQEREVLPLGGTTPRKINVRVIAASNRDLLVLAEKGEFRRDLYYRMSGLLIRVPALRERKEDIPALALGFLERTARDHRKSIVGISRRAMGLLLEHEWPGNVRELQNEVARAVLFSHDRGVLHTDHFETVAEAVAAHEATAPHPSPPVGGSAVKAAAPGVAKDGLTLQEMVDEVEREAIVRALESVNGNKSKAARLLGITRNGLAMKMKRLGL